MNILLFLAKQNTASALSAKLNLYLPHKANKTSIIHNIYILIIHGLHKHKLRKQYITDKGLFSSLTSVKKKGAKREDIVYLQWN